ncbi:MAG: SMC-Scp complex subunit ScpB [Methanocellales archaeon]|nr:SMC-Scp complex subunit ScpB [Methanocellales archaeon]
MSDKEILEAALFAAGQPLSVKELAELLGKPVEQVAGILDSLLEEYKTRDTSLELTEIDGKYVMQVKPRYAELVRDVAPREFGAPVLRTLSVIAYRQPITQAAVIEIRGNKAYSHIAEMVERGLVKATKHGRTKMLTTTSAFAEYFRLETNDPGAIKKTIEELVDAQKLMPLDGLGETAPTQD